MNHPAPSPAMSLAEAWAAAEAAYQRVAATADPPPSLIAELHHRAKDLAHATACPTPASCTICLDAPTTLPPRLRRRWYGANRGARWIVRHCH
ncbi:hypothetical protein [Streptomyces lutosisoli]|uniref:Uncharacterized protein n=1 Tax=Streptomyces lutosisoli TaxID=2665721 RepID=A0ABW2VVY4_9ACTN